jgi:hypothetical protein
MKTYFIKLTYSSGGKSVYINPVWVIYIGLGGSERGTFVKLVGEDEPIEVKETQEAILSAITKAT